MRHWLLVGAAALIGAEMSRADELACAPFATLQRRGDAIAATLPSDSRYLVVNTPDLRMSDTGESFVLADGAVLVLAERHFNYRITCRMSPAPARLHIEFIDAMPAPDAPMPSRVCAVDTAPPTKL